MRLERTLATRFLMSRRREKYLSVASMVAVVGFAFGVAALLVALSILSGFQEEYKRAVLAFNSHLILMKADEIEDPEAVAGQLSRYFPKGSLKGWTPFLYREGMAVSGSRVKGLVLKGVDFTKYSNLSRMRIDYDPEKARAMNPDRLPTILLGAKLQEELVPSGGILKILFPRGVGDGRESLKDVRRFFVAGTFESGLYEYDSSFAFISLQEAVSFFKTGGSVSGVEIWLDDPDNAEHWAEAMKKDFSFPYVVMTWRELNENLFRALEVEKFIFFVILGVLIAVATLNILGALLMLLLEKRGEVAVLRALGVTWRRLRKVFLFDGLLIGFLGVALGVILGLGFLFFLEKWQPIELAPEIYFVRHVPVVYHWRNFFWVVSSAFFILFVGCEVALRGITRMNVVRALVETR